MSSVGKPISIEVPFVKLPLHQEGPWGFGHVDGECIAVMQPDEDEWRITDIFVTAEDRDGGATKAVRVREDEWWLWSLIADTIADRLGTHISERFAMEGV